MIESLDRFIFQNGKLLEEEPFFRQPVRPLPKRIEIDAARKLFHIDVVRMVAGRHVNMSNSVDQFAEDIIDFQIDKNGSE